MEGGTKASPAMCVEPGRPSGAFGVEGSSADTAGINHVIDNWMNLCRAYVRK